MGKGGIIREFSKPRSEAKHSTAKQSTAQQSKPHSTDSTRVRKMGTRGVLYARQRQVTHRDREPERKIEIKSQRNGKRGIKTGG
jgi:hypothetical protein